MQFHGEAQAPTVVRSESPNCLVSWFSRRFGCCCGSILALIVGLERGDLCKRSYSSLEQQPFHDAEPTVGTDDLLRAGRACELEAARARASRARGGVQHRKAAELSIHA